MTTQRLKKGGGEDAWAGATREVMQKATDARKKGDYAKARALYGAALSHDPANGEALWGLAEAARGQGDRPAAGSYYKSALAVNRNFCPPDSATQTFLGRVKRGEAPIRSAILEQSGGHTTRWVNAEAEWPNVRREAQENRGEAAGAFHWHWLSASETAPDVFLTAHALHGKASLRPSAL